MLYRLILLGLLASCSAAPLTDGELLEAPAGDKSDGVSDPLATSLREQYGVRPRRYGGFFTTSDQAAQQAFLAALEPVTSELSARLTGPFAGLDLLEPELATNFIAEGGYFALVDNVTVDLESFYHLGLDTLVARADSLRPLISPGLYAWITNPVNQYDEVNELGTPVKNVWLANMHDALEASGAMFILARRDFVADYRARGGDPATLDDPAWFFWTTVYFNGGSAAGRQALTRHGIDWYKQRWTAADDPARYGGIIRYNALWRTASYAYLAATQYQ